MVMGAGPRTTTSTDATSPPGPPVPPGWVPVEQRLLGMDRRSLVPALVVALFGVVTFWGLPALNQAVSVTDPVRAGDVVQVGEAAQFTPTVGWDLASGVRQGEASIGQYPRTSQVSSGGVSFTVVTDSYDGTPRQLLAQIRRNNDRMTGDNPVDITGSALSFRTTTGQTGALTKFTSGEGVGLIAAFVFDGTGVEVEAYGPDTIARATERDLVDMLESVRPVETEGGAR